MILSDLRCSNALCDSIQTIRYNTRSASRDAVLPGRPKPTGRPRQQLPSVEWLPRTRVFKVLGSLSGTHLVQRWSSIEHKCWKTGRSSRGLIPAQQLFYEQQGIALLTTRIFAAHLRHVERSIQIDPDTWRFLRIFNSSHSLNSEHCRKTETRYSLVVLLQNNIFSKTPNGLIHSRTIIQ